VSRKGKCGTSSQQKIERSDRVGENVRIESTHRVLSGFRLFDALPTQDLLIN
jgi:hypothetical protein